MKRFVAALMILALFPRPASASYVLVSTSTLPTEWTSATLTGPVYYDSTTGSYRSSAPMYDTSASNSFINSLSDRNTWVAAGAADPDNPSWAEANNIVPPLTGNGGSSDVIISPAAGGFVVKVVLHAAYGTVSGFAGTVHYDLYTPSTGARSQSFVAISCGAQSSNPSTVTSGIITAPPGTRVIVWVHGIGVQNLWITFSLLNAEFAFI